MRARPTLDRYLAHSAHQSPKRPAVQFRTEELTYEQLFHAATALARTLAECGVGSGQRAALWLPKGLEAIVSIHGILTAGAAYVPIDPASPVVRAAYLLRDCDAACLITTRDHFELLRPELDHLQALRLVVIVGDEPKKPQASDWMSVTSWAAAMVPKSPLTLESTVAEPDELAYVLYTSGSTGTPKGVMLSHRNGDVLVQWACDHLHFDESDRVASHAPLHFDLSIIDVFCSAAVGATLVLVPDHHRMLGAALVRFLVAERITVWYSVPGALIALLDARNNAHLSGAVLRVILYAGEVFPPRRLRDLLATFPHAQVYNLYGPTETNVCTWHQVTARELADGAAGGVPIGGLCDFAEGHLVDDHGRVRRLAPGFGGELVIGGPSVMLGYWGGPHPMTEGDGVSAARYPAVGSRTHRTGDLVHVNSDGEMVFDGRTDDMVKIRGYRVEPAEVEAAILANTDVSEACVVAVVGDDGVSRLEAYVVAKTGREVDLSSVRRVCSDRLPRYMLPAHFSCIAALPRGSTGKLDRRTLSALAHASDGDGGRRRG